MVSWAIERGAKFGWGDIYSGARPEGGRQLRPGRWDTVKSFSQRRLFGGEGTIVACLHGNENNAWWPTNHKICTS